jgi:hypothetical protein
VDLVDRASRVARILITTGAGMRIVYCFLRMVLADDEAPMYKRRARNALVFLILSQGVFVLKAVIIRYFS